MAADPSFISGRQPEFRIDPSMKIGYVSLNVSDLPRSIEFYESILGFKAASGSGGKALLYAAGGNGGSSQYLLELKQAPAAGSGAAGKRAGLYHFAVLLPERRFLADALAHLGENRERVRFEGMADHLVSESIYIRDPDSIGIEIYCDRPRPQWEWDNSSGRVQMATERLDTDGLLREASGQGWEGMPAGATIGHVHLHVSSLEKASRFYSDALGLDLTCEFPGARFFAAGRYHHHVAANTWLGRGLSPAQPGGMGLDHFAIELPGAEALADAMKHVLLKSGHAAGSAPTDASAFLRDADGIAVRLYCGRQ